MAKRYGSGNTTLSPPAASPAPGTWTATTAVPKADYQIRSMLDGDTVYVFGGIEATESNADGSEQSRLRETGSVSTLRIPVRLTAPVSDHGRRDLIPERREQADKQADGQEWRQHDLGALEVKRWPQRSDLRPRLRSGSVWNRSVELRFQL